MTAHSKAEMRRQVRAHRATLSDEHLQHQGEQLAGVLERHIHPDAVVTGYLPMGGEPNLLPFLYLHVARTGAVFLPVVPEHGKHLGWESWNPCSPIRKHPRMPLYEPDPGPHGPGSLRDVVEAAAEVTVTELEWEDPLIRQSRQHPAHLVLLVPALAIDTSGARLGQGGGYYDTSLAQLPELLQSHPDLECEVMAVVHPLEVMDTGSFPAEPHDLRVTRVATEYRVAEV